MDNLETPADVRVVSTPNTWIEGEAVRQLETTARLPGMRLAVGLPDLHPGKGHPVGAAFLSTGAFHPLLVGNDIGCGMALHQTDLSAHKPKLERWQRRLAALDEEVSFADLERWLQGALPSGHTSGLGTIGGGNHFAELHRVRDVESDALDRERLLLLVHTGSRGLGEAVLRAHVDVHKGAGLAEGTVEASQYLQRHDEALAWAKVNRRIVAARFLEAVAAQARPVLDITHNEVVRRPEGFLHRKGAAPADAGLVVLPGSRGDLTFVLEPTEKAATTDACAWSLAHGAGRRWKRTECRGRLRERFTRESLTRTRFGGRVVCNDVDLLYEEAPQAYKDATSVVDALVAHGLARVVAVLEPLLTFKTSRGQR